MYETGLNVNPNLISLHNTHRSCIQLQSSWIHYMYDLAVIKISVASNMYLLFIFWLKEEKQILH